VLAVGLLATFFLAPARAQPQAKLSAEEARKIDG